MADNLKPCPFCGGEAALKSNEYGCGVYDCAGALVDTYYEKPTVFWCECNECGAMATGCDTFGEAIEAWNRRVDDGKIQG